MSDQSIDDLIDPHNCDVCDRASGPGPIKAPRCSCVTGNSKNYVATGLVNSFITSATELIFYLDLRTCTYAFFQYLF